MVCQDLQHVSSRSYINEGAFEALWRLAFTMNGSLCEIKNWKRFRDMILSLSDNQGSKKEVFFRTFSQKLAHSVMLLKCLHLTTTSL